MVLFYDDIGKDVARGGYDCGARVIGRRFKGEDCEAARTCGASCSVNVMVSGWSSIQAHIQAPRRSHEQSTSEVEGDPTPRPTPFLSSSLSMASSSIPHPSPSKVSFPLPVRVMYSHFTIGILQSHIRL